MPRTTRHTARSRKKKKTLNQRDQGILDALTELTVAEPQLSDCPTREDEFKVLKRNYHQQCLEHHPDKGGDAGTFRRIHASFQLLKDQHHKNRKKNSWLFSDVLTGHDNDNDNDDNDDDDDVPFHAEQYYADFDAFFAATGHMPSWQYYQAAAQEPLPTYRVELAKRGRSKCQQTVQTAKKCHDSLYYKGKAKECTDVTDVQGGVELIGKGEIRIGVLNGQSGTYSRWVHLRCWRVPIKVWLGLPYPPEKSTTDQFAAALHQMEEILVTGFGELPQTDQQAFIAHCQDRDNWAEARTMDQKAMVDAALGKGEGKQSKPSQKSSKKTKAVQEDEDDEMEPKPKKIKKKAAKKEVQDDDDEMEDEMETETADVKPKAVASSTAVAVAKAKAPSTELVASSSALVVTAGGKPKFVLPIPGRNGASDETVFRGKTFVLTGLFPEVGGGAGLDLGKGRVKEMIQSFGGKVTGAISGKTAVLVVGAEPGMSKVKNARERPHCQLGSLHDLKVGLDQGLEALEEFEFYQQKEPFKIQSFSKGYQYANPAIGYNGLALQASEEELAIAQGFVSPEKKKPASGKKKANGFAELQADDDHHKEALLALPPSENDHSKPAAKKKAPAKKKKAAAKKKPAAKKRGRKALVDVADNVAVEEDEEEVPAGKKARASVKQEEEVSA